MNTIFKDIILVICDFLDDRSKLSFLSTTSQNHELKNATKFEGPIHVDSTIWYINSFCHCFDYYNSGISSIKNPNGLPHLILIRHFFLEHNCYGFQPYYLFNSLNFKYVTFRLIIDVPYRINCWTISTTQQDNNFLLFCVENNIKIVYEIIFQSKSKAVINYNHLTVGIHIPYVIPNIEIRNYLSTFNTIIIKSGHLELNKKYIIQQKID